MNLKLRKIAAAVASYLGHAGLVVGALDPEVDKLDSIPEFQRSWYVQDAATKKFKLDLTKVDVEDTTALKTTVTSERAARIAAEKKAKQDLQDALAPYAGIDPVKTKEILSKLGNDEEATLIANGKIEQVIERRMVKVREEFEKKLKEAEEQRDGAMEVASTYMDRVLDNEVRAAVTGKVHPSAISDILRAAREIFSLDDEGRAVQFDDDGKPVLGKNAKDLFSPAEWVEGQKTIAPHWFPVTGSGGGGPGDKNNNAGGKDLSGLNPVARITAAREAAAAAAGGVATAATSATK